MSQPFLGIFGSVVTSLISYFEGGDKFFCAKSDKNKPKSYFCKINFDSTVTIVGVTLWWTVGFNMVLFLASLQDIPETLYEASEIDGATRWEQFRYITLPQLVPIGRVIVLLQILASYKVFAQILLITGGGPSGATRPLIQYIYEVGFTQNNLGYAATMSYALFFILLVLSIIQLKSQRAEGN